MGRYNITELIENKDKDGVKNYLMDTFKFQRAQKYNAVYINLCRLYEHYPQTITEIIKNIPTLGYWKDYFFILKFSRNKELTRLIYNIIIKKLRVDINKYNQGQSISSLAKWLPREGSKLEKRINFIDTVNQELYPKCNRITARKKHRQLVS
ncbi:unnamed protein product, partial [marine sediment metagenome]